MIYHRCSRCGERTNAHGNYCAACAPLVVAESHDDTNQEGSDTR